MSEKVSYRLRKEDIQEMVDDGSIGKQHFLIQYLAKDLKLKPRKRRPLPTHKHNG